MLDNVYSVDPIGYSITERKVVGISNNPESITDIAVRRVDIYVDIRRKLEAVATKKIREEINLVLPKVYQQLLEALEKGEELKLE